MPDFYKKTALVFLGLLSLTLLFAWYCHSRETRQNRLFPSEQSHFPWRLETITDADRGGSSSVTLYEDSYGLDYEYHLREQIEFPYIVTVLHFKTPDGIVNLTRHSSVSFLVKCSQKNHMTFYLLGYDDKVTRPGDFYTYRIAEKIFSCEPQWQEVKIDLRYLSVPIWWLETQGLPVGDQGYSLAKVIALGFDASRRGPLSETVRVKIGELVLHSSDGRYWFYFYALSGLAWLLFLIWSVRQYTLYLVAKVNERINKSRPLVAYQQLSIEPHRDEDKSKVLRLLATEYANPSMSLEYCQAVLGIPKSQITLILKKELGLSFSHYVNRLRLAEAARLLAGLEVANVAEIAYSVGYKNISYFNKLFKSEYGCTPNSFRKMSQANKLR